MFSFDQRAIHEMPVGGVGAEAVEGVEFALDTADNHFGTTGERIAQQGPQSVTLGKVSGTFNPHGTAAEQLDQSFEHGLDASIRGTRPEP
jgi:hypothetical protein